MTTNEAEPRIELIELAHLHPHPRNANVMRPELRAKLRRHLEAGGPYEPLVVRPHPEKSGAYQLINGHHRAAVLRQLGRTHANCVVWAVDDTQTLMLLATINRLAGSDAAAKRLGLLEALHAALPAAELGAFLPESKAALAKVLNTPADVPALAPVPPLDEMPEAFTVFLPRQQKQRLIASLKRTHADLAQALLQWAELAEAHAPAATIGS